MRSAGCARTGCCSPICLAADRKLTEGLLRSGVVAIAYRPSPTAWWAAGADERGGRADVGAGRGSLPGGQGGLGILLGGVPGVAAAKVVILGGGVSGTNAARVAMGMERMSR